MPRKVSAPGQMAYVMKHAAEHILCCWCQDGKTTRIASENESSDVYVRGEKTYRRSIHDKYHSGRQSNVLVLMVYIIITLMTDSVLRFRIDNEHYRIYDNWTNTF